MTSVLTEYKKIIKDDKEKFWGDDISVLYQYQYKNSFFLTLLFFNLICNH